MNIFKKVAKKMKRLLRIKNEAKNYFNRGRSKVRRICIRMGQLMMCPMCHFPRRRFHLMGLCINCARRMGR